MFGIFHLFFPSRKFLDLEFSNFFLNFQKCEIKVFEKTFFSRISQRKNFQKFLPSTHKFSFFLRFFRLPFLIRTVSVVHYSIKNTYVKKWGIFFIFLFRPKYQNFISEVRMKKKSFQMSKFRDNMILQRDLANISLTEFYNEISNWEKLYHICLKI